MSILRIISWIMVLLGVALVGADGVSTLEQGVPVLRSTADILQLFGLDVASNPDATSGLQKAGNVVLNVPLWALIMAIGLIMTLILRPLD